MTLSKCKASRHTSTFIGLMTLAGVAIGTITSASAETYNYLFPDGANGFALQSTGGTLNPGVLVGFNPQPDPPGMPPTFLALDDATSPVFTQYPPGPCEPSSCGSYRISMSFLGIGTPGLVNPPEPEFIGTINSDSGLQDVSGTQFSFTANTHNFVVALAIAGPGVVADWVAFNPQPDPPGDGFGVQFDFGGFHGDPQFAFSVSEDGTPLQFQLAPTPLPAAFPLFATGLGVMGLLGWRRKRTRAAVTA